MEPPGGDPFAPSGRDQEPYESRRRPNGPENPGEYQARGGQLLGQDLVDALGQSLTPAFEFPWEAVVRRLPLNHPHGRVQ